MSAERGDFGWATLWPEAEGPTADEHHGETRWYVADTEEAHIEEYAQDGADKGAPFRRLVVNGSGELQAEGSSTGPGARSLALLTFNPRTKVGGLSIMVETDGETSRGGSSYELSARCESVSVDLFRSDKRTTSALAPR